MKIFKIIDKNCIIIYIKCKWANDFSKKAKTVISTQIHQDQLYDV